MEHRSYGRCDVNLEVSLYQNLMQAPGIIKNLGDNGAFIQTDVNIDIHQKVGVRCFLDDTSVFDDCQFTAIVVHRMKGGFGVEINEPDLQTRLALQWQAEARRKLHSKSSLF